MYRTTSYFAWTVLLGTALWGFSMPLQAGEDRLERRLTTHERIMVQDALNAYSLQIDPEYYLSGEYIEDLEALQTAKTRKRRIAIKRHQIELNRRIEEHAQRQQYYRDQQARVLEENRRKQIAHQAKWQAKQREYQRYRCTQFYQQQKQAQRLAQRNPQYVYRRPPNLPGC